MIGVDLQPSAISASGYRPLVLDLSNRELVLGQADLLRSAQAIFHLAAKLPQGDDDPLEPHLLANLRTTENLLEALDGSGVPLVQSSTMSVYGLPPRSLPVSEDELPRPIEAYGLTKLAAECAAERMARAGRVPCIALRYSGIFGVGYNYGAIHLYASKALKGETVSVYGGGKVVRDYAHVDDIVAINLLAARNAVRLGWGLFHAGGGQAMSLLEVARITVECVGKGRRGNQRPAGPIRFCLRHCPGQGGIRLRSCTPKRSYRPVC